MFDLGFSEIMLIMIVALVVVGPERLPGLARKAGYWVGRFRRYVVNVRSEIERELNADELRSMLTRQEDEIRELRDMLQDTRSQIRNEVDDIAHEVDSAGEQLRQSIGPDAASGNGEVPGEDHKTEALTEERKSEATSGEHEPEAPGEEYDSRVSSEDKSEVSGAEQTSQSDSASGQTRSSPASGDSGDAAAHSEKSVKP
ncbi:MAG: Sec-independent protein translocase protein TatB [Acidihalobacter sp.]|jgi:sec-independent protein translocase protein TatB